MAKRGTQFQTIRTEGAILPPDILRRVASLKVEGATPDAYHLPPGTKLNEAISQSWTALLNHWQAFQEAREKLLADGETGTAVTNERWLLPLFNELDYGRLITTKSPVIDERSYPIERFYNHTPIHLIGCKLPLDRRTKGARGAATASPHSMVQEFLNQSDEHVWAFLSNGLQLRILRDNVSLSRQTFVEFDLEAMMEGEVYADFALLWLLCHQSRIESDKPEDCWLEKWSKLAREQGTRVLDDLRVGVGNAIEALGRGFIGHPRNDHLREKLHSGTLTKDEFYRQLLRIVYRLLFLFVAEDRELLHSDNASKEGCDLYDTNYSTRRLRELALKMRGTKHADLWHSLSLVFDVLGRNDGCPLLGLCGLGSFLWRASSTADLLGPHQANGEAALITNDDLLQAVRALAYVEQGRMLRIVDYRNMGSEELGSVYESLLELHPVMNVEAKSFELTTASGSERRTGGSYYTPDSLVQCLLDSAMDPVIAERIAGKKGEAAERAVLDIKVCDPASGSGHFLIAAAHRLARHLARARTGEAEPSPEDYQHALRDVIGHCLYGVDINPMAVELCKVSLWIEAIEPGKPLSFLDHHIQCGNSLLGATPALLANGIPDDAFKPIEGDDKRVCSDLKKSNRREREDYASGQGYLFSTLPKLGNLPDALAKLNRADDETLADIAAKEKMYAELVNGAAYHSAQLLADTWCAAFVWKKDNSDIGRLCPTERTFRSAEDNPHNMNIHVKAEAKRLARDFQFFHWYLAFPDVFPMREEGRTGENTQTGCSGGFDIVLSNPPWERVNLQEKEWFSDKRPDIAGAPNASARKRLIASLKTEDPDLFRQFYYDVRRTEGESHFLRNSNAFPLTGRGDINLYAVFAETMRASLTDAGRVGCILPTGIVTDDTTKYFFQDVVEKGTLISVFDFENKYRIFPAVAPVVKFCLFVSTRTVAKTTQELALAEFVFFALRVDDIVDEQRRFRLSSADIALLNPNTRTCPIFRSRRDAELTKDVYRRVPIFIHEGSPAGNLWNADLSRMMHMADDSHLFCSREKLESQDFKLSGNIFYGNGEEYMPLYEAKLFHQFNHRQNTFEGIPIKDRFKVKAPTKELSCSELVDPLTVMIPRYWVSRSDLMTFVGNEAPAWLILFRDMTNVMTNSRNAVFCIVPLVGVGHSAQTVTVKESRLAPILLGNFNAFVFDYLARQKLAGGHLTFFILRQLSALPPGTYSGPCTWTNQNSSSPERGSLAVWLLPRVIELTYTAWDLAAFASDCGYDGPPFRWDEKRRFLLRCELDAAYFHLYLSNTESWGSGNSELIEMFPTPRDAVDYILETFPLVKRKDEKDHGEYRTKRVILEIYDEMAEAIRTGKPFQTRLGPPPGPPTDAESHFIPMAEWNLNDWPSHIHSATRGGFKNVNGQT